MDREQEELKFLGVFGILKQSFKILHKWKKIFAQISLVLVLPLAFISLADLQISDFLSHNNRNETAILWCFRVLFSFIVLTLSLLSTAAVVYTIASIYTAKEVTFKRAMKIVPKVWKRLMLTFLCTLLAIVVYNFVAALIFVGWYAIGMHGRVRIATLIIIVIIYAVGFLYLTIIWQMASVVTVLEKSYAFRAMIKSKNLIKGKLWTAGILFFLLNLTVVGVNVVFLLFVVQYYNWQIGITQRVGYGFLCLLLLFVFILLGLVIQTILYFVCKSYHQEVIDKSELSDHLEVIYLGKHVPSKSRVQLEQVPV